MSKEIDVIDKVGVSDSYLKAILEASLTKVSDEVVEKIVKVIIAKGKTGLVVNFVCPK